MNIDLTGRRALVTGSTSGIGAAIAVGLAQAGAHVVVNGRSEERTAAAARRVGERSGAPERVRRGGRGRGHRRRAARPSSTPPPTSTS